MSFFFFSFLWCFGGFLLIYMVTLRELPTANLADVLLVAETTSRCHNWLQAVLWFWQLSACKRGGRVFGWNPFKLWWQERRSCICTTACIAVCRVIFVPYVLPYNIYVYIQLATSYWMCIWGIVALSLILLPIFSCTNMVAAIKDCWSCCEIIIEVLYSSAGQY